MVNIVGVTDKIRLAQERRSNMFMYLDKFIGQYSKGNTHNTTTPVKTVKNVKLFMHLGNEHNE